ncbi:bifunctional DNA primase/polymerase [Polymorphospora sp. NPDC050346]|uniref:bifunctional DNA primase/polymerase n=1 Tax=Polymorphospora sp. NPDC050346 TaxID=3155780 RepID=UPI0033D9D26A
MSDLLTAALGYAERGWHVFPLNPDRPGNADEDYAKRPAFPNRCTADRCDQVDPRCRATGRHVGWEERATVDPDRIRRAWSTRPYNIGIACGPSGLVVVDPDVPKHPGDTPPAEWAGSGTGMDVFAVLAARHGSPIGWIAGYGRPDTPPREGIDVTYTVDTPSGGSHLYYQHPASGPQLRNTTSDRGRGLGWKIDTRAHGGYVVAGGSTVTGRPYKVALDCDPLPLPEWIATLLTPAPLPAQGPTVVNLAAGRAGRYLATAIDGAVTHLRTAADGYRNNALFNSAMVLGQLVAGGSLTSDDVYAVLTPVARSLPGKTPLTEREIARTIASGLRVGATRPRSVAA